MVLPARSAPAASSRATAGDVAIAAAWVRSQSGLPHPVTWPAISKMSLDAKRSPFSGPSGAPASCTLSCGMKALRGSAGGWAMAAHHTDASALAQPGRWARLRASSPVNSPWRLGIMSRTIWHWVDGKPVESRSNRFGNVFNPATGEVQARVSLASKGEVDAAVAAAGKAFPAWSQTPPLQRARVMFRFKTLVEANLDRL